VTDDATDAIASKRDDLVRHDLGSNAKPVRAGRLDNRAQAVCRANLGRQRTHNDRRCSISQFIGLHDNRRTRLAEIAGRHDQNNIAAGHDSSLLSCMASSHASIAAFSGCLARSAPSRRMAARTRGFRRSGTQCWIRRSPFVRRRSRADRARFVPILAGIDLSPLHQLIVIFAVPLGNANLGGTLYCLTHTSTFSAAMNASCGISTLPNWRMRFLPFFCLSRSLRLREMSPP
jgi:hypothetical protein